MTKAVAMGCVLAVMLTAAVAAQVKTISGESRTVVATVESIEASSRQVTLKDAEGTYHELYVPRDVKRFDQIKIGDRLRFTYYENVTLRPHAPGTRPIDETTGGKTPNPEGKAGATMAVQRTITATITAVDMTVPSVTFKGPNNWTYSSRVEDKAALAKVKVGDQFDITWTSAMVAGIEDAK